RATRSRRSRAGRCSSTRVIRPSTRPSPGTSVSPSAPATTSSCRSGPATRPRNAENARVTAKKQLDFGFCTPPGDREMGSGDRAMCVAAEDRLIEVAARFCDSIWVSDHVMEHDRYRVEPWTQLTWIAARHPRVRLGHNVLSNSYRHPPLMAKMAAGLQELSGGRFILGYGAGWLEPEYRG